MDKDLEKIETRSKKVRDIMVEKPPFFIRYGTVMIAVLLFVVALVIYSIF